MTAPRGPHEGHHHQAIDPNADKRRLRVVLALILAFLCGEVVVGILAHSLALLSDAGHMLTDAGAIGLSLVAVNLAARPSKGGLTFGLKRAEILSALVNGATLLVLGAFVVYEAIHRLIAPPRVEGLPMLAVAIAGIGVNLLATWQLAKANRTSLNIRGSYKHILTDLYAFVGTAVAAVLVLTTGFFRADSLASLAVAALMLHASYQLLRDAGRILLEAAPVGMEPREIGQSLVAHPCVTNVHDLHVWEITSGFPALSAHVLVRPGDDCHKVREDLEQLLDKRFGIAHTTLQVDHDQAGRLLSIRTQTGRSGDGDVALAKPDQAGDPQRDRDGEEADQGRDRYWAARDLGDVRERRDVQ
jgi:cobalt-zinc-cadmium efflux system protein